MTELSVTRFRANHSEAHTHLAGKNSRFVLSVFSALSFWGHAHFPLIRLLISKILICSWDWKLTRRKTIWRWFVLGWTTLIACFLIRWNRHNAQTEMFASIDNWKHWCSVFGCHMRPNERVLIHLVNVIVAFIACVCTFLLAFLCIVGRKLGKVFFLFAYKRAEEFSPVGIEENFNVKLCNELVISLI